MGLFLRLSPLGLWGFIMVYYYFIKQPVVWFNIISCINIFSLEINLEMFVLTQASFSEKYTLILLLYNNNYYKPY